MALLEEVLAAGPAALRLPRALLRRGWRVSDEVAEGPAVGGRPPVVLVHGYCGTDQVWDPLVRALHAAGFPRVSRVSYNPFNAGVSDLLEAIGSAVGAAAEGTGAPGVHLVGHSLGGLLVRCAVQCGSLPVPALTAVTIATPHRGCALASFAVGPFAPLLRPGSALLAGSGRLDPAVRWVSFYSDADVVVPPASARLEQSGVAVANVRVPGPGHLTICRDPGLVGGVVAELLDAGREVAGAAVVPLPAPAPGRAPRPVALAA